MKGIVVNVYRPAGFPDCTNGGVTAKADTVLLVGDGVPEVAEASEGMAVLVFDPRRGWEHPSLTPVARPLTSEKKWTMFGGNFVWSSDSRFRTRVSQAPLPVHDRVE